jgi:hypothetical protein
MLDHVQGGCRRLAGGEVDESMRAPYDLVRDRERGALG